MHTRLLMPPLVFLPYDEDFGGRSEFRNVTCGYVMPFVSFERIDFLRRRK